jgi:hypothetical protein
VVRYTLVFIVLLWWLPLRALALLRGVQHSIQQNDECVTLKWCLCFCGGCLVRALALLLRATTATLGEAQACQGFASPQGFTNWCCDCGTSHCLCGCLVRAVAPLYH